MAITAADDVGVKGRSMGIWAYRDYILFSVRARLISETINNHLGILWLALEPLLRMIVYYVVFVYLMKSRTENFVAFLLIGIMSMMWFTKTVIQGGHSIKGAGGLLRQCYMPKTIFPTIMALSRLVEFLCVILVLMAYFAVTGSVHYSWVALPVVILSQFIINFGVSLLASAFIPLMPDLSILINSAMTALFFLSGVFFEVQPTSPHYDLFMLNPLAKLLEQYRWVLLHGKWPDWTALLIINGVGLIIIGIAAFFIQKFDSYYPRF